MSIFDQMLARYEIKTNYDYINAQTLVPGLPGKIGF
jgi:hypothetical protein